MQSRNPNNARGIDVSHYQGDVDFHLVRSAGLSFVIVKATEGSRGTDDQFERNVCAARDAGLVVGAYHFCRAISRTDAVGEAEHFLSVVQSVGGVDFVCVDVETPEGGSRNNIIESARAWVEHVKQATGMQPVLYTYPAFIDEHLDGGSLADLPLWYASYSSGAPRDRGGWSRWTFLQHSDKGSVPGIGGPVDLNEFDGTEQDLRNSLVTASAPERNFTDDAGNKVCDDLSALYMASGATGVEAAAHYAAEAVRGNPLDPVSFSQDDARKVIADLGTLYDASIDDEVHKSAHFAAEALRSATGIKEE